MACNFNGTSQYLNVASAPVSGFPMTICVWARPAVGGVNGTICSVGMTAGTHRNQVSFRGDGFIQIFAQGTTTSATVIGPAYSADTLYHVAGVFESSNSRAIYVNATATTNATNIGSQNTANHIMIGARDAGALGIYFSGQIAEVGIWNAALTQPEIASLAKGMTCDKVRPESLVFYAPLVRDLQDISGGLTITNNNAATVANHPRIYP